MAKNISSKEAYFQRPNNTLTLEAWEAFKQANPQSEYVGEVCWDLHDTMIMRGKPELDSMVVIKKLLAELNIEFTLNVEYLEITSDLSGKAIMVLDIENDELVLQLEKAGATVVYVTSNWNYNTTIPNRYFEMYDDRAHETYLATDKRNLFARKNVIVRPISFYDYKSDSFYSILYNIINDFKETTHMQIDKVLMNPPYDGSTHLKVLDTTLKTVRLTNPRCEVVSIQPVRWLEDPLAEYKQGSDYKKYKSSITDKLSRLQLLDVMTASTKFNITADQDLAIYTFNKNTAKIEIYPDIVKSIISKIKAKSLPACSQFIEYDRVDGWRCETFKVKSLGQAVTVKASTNTYTSDGWEFMISGDKGYYHDGKCSDGRWWTENRQATQHTRKVGEPFAQSFSFKSEQGCANFYTSTHSKFFINLVYMLKTDMNLMPVLNHLPYMGNYEVHAWTDEDYCEFFGLTDEEAEFMCRTVDDYRVKDFINYISLED